MVSLLLPAARARQAHRVCAGDGAPHHHHRRRVARAAAAALLPVRRGAAVRHPAGRRPAAGLPGAGGRAEECCARLCALLRADDALGPPSGSSPLDSHPLACMLSHHLVQTRRSLYDMFSLYCEEAQTPGQFKTDLRRIITQGRCRPPACCSRVCALLPAGMHSGGRGKPMQLIHLALLLQPRPRSRTPSSAGSWRRTSSTAQVRCAVCGVCGWLAGGGIIWTHNWDNASPG